jgi:hypothetical protein
MSDDMSVRLQNNNDLYRYVLSLASELAQRGKSEACSRLTLASQFAFGSPSEFFHEALTALNYIQADCKDVLAPIQLEDLALVIEEIHAAFQLIGGA